MGDRWNSPTSPPLIYPVRKLLEATGLPWVIENVPGALSDMRSPHRADRRDVRSRCPSPTTLRVQPHVARTSSSAATVQSRRLRREERWAPDLDAQGRLRTPLRISSRKPRRRWAWTGPTGTGPKEAIPPTYTEIHRGPAGRWTSIPTGGSGGGWGSVMLGGGGGARGVPGGAAHGGCMGGRVWGEAGGQALEPCSLARSRLEPDLEPDLERPSIECTPYLPHPRARASRDHSRGKPATSRRTIHGKFQKFARKN